MKNSDTSMLCDLAHAPWPYRSAVDDAKFKMYTSLLFYVDGVSPRVIKCMRGGHICNTPYM